MKKQQASFYYRVYDSIDTLEEVDKLLLKMARDATANAYAPYSHFHVGAAARLNNGQFIKGTNQENASYPVGICAERVLMSAVASQHPGTTIETMAISYHSGNGNSNQPIAPCGMCRQSLQEYEMRVKKPIRLILAGLEGKIFVFEKASQLLPLGFTSDDMSRG